MYEVESQRRQDAKVGMLEEFHESTADYTDYTDFLSSFIREIREIRG